MSYDPANPAQVSSTLGSFNLLEALKVLPGPTQTGTTKKIWRVLGNNAPIPSYFSSVVDGLYEDPLAIHFQLESKSIPSSHHINHPAWKGWKAIWSAPPIELDPNNISSPSPELNFQNILFRIEVTAEQLRNENDPRLIYQGTTIVFQGFDASRVRYVVEWCCHIEGQKAYLKVVGTDKNKFPYPYNDTHHPSFILVVPAHLTRVAAPQQPTLARMWNKMRSSCPFSLVFRKLP
jgi:hypothetical protein